MAIKYNEYLKKKTEVAHQTSEEESKIEAVGVPSSAGSSINSIIKECIVQAKKVEQIMMDDFAAMEISLDVAVE